MIKQLVYILNNNNYLIFNFKILIIIHFQTVFHCNITYNIYNYYNKKYFYFIIRNDGGVIYIKEAYCVFCLLNLNSFINNTSI